MNGDDSSAFDDTTEEEVGDDGTAGPDEPATAPADAE